MEIQNISGADVVVRNFSSEAPQKVERQETQATEQQKATEENKGTRIDTFA